MGIHLGCGLVVPRSAPEVVLAALGKSTKGRQVYVHGPLPIAGPARKPWDFVVVRELAPARTMLNPFTNKPVRVGGDYQAAKPLHASIASKGFALGEEDAFVRALSQANGDLPIAYLTETSSPEMHSFGVLRKGRWVGFASAGDARPSAYITVSKAGKVTSYASADKAHAVDDLARELGAHWKPKRGSIAKFGLVRGITFADWFHAATEEPPLLYSIEEGDVELSHEGKLHFGERSSTAQAEEDEASHRAVAPPRSVRPRASARARR